MEELHQLPAQQPALWQRLPRIPIRQQDAVMAWLMVLPSLLVILGVTLQPILTTLYLSLFKVSSGLNQPRTFVGLANYRDLLSDPMFWAAAGRTLYFTLVSVGLELLLGLAIAKLINARPSGWQFLRISLIIPWAFPTIVNGTMWKWIYSADFGALNGVLFQLGLIDHYVPWLIKPWTAMNLVIIADMWHVTAFVALVLQAALATIPDELDEAARVEGANAWQRFLYVQLPMLQPAILVVLIVRTVEAFRVFDLVYILTGGGPAFGTVTISYLTYLETFAFSKLGSGAALSFLVSMFTLMMAVVYIKLLYRPQEETA
jgi:ABC-type sugar transport system permease subunit